jgi:hypothetical protein
MSHSTEYITFFLSVVRLSGQEAVQPLTLPTASRLDMLSCHLQLFLSSTCQRPRTYQRPVLSLLDYKSAVLAKSEPSVRKAAFTVWTCRLSRVSGHHEQTIHIAGRPKIGEYRPDEVSFISLESHDIIYRIPFTKSREGHYFSKDGTLQDTFTTIIFSAPTIGTVTDRILHRRLRNRMAPAFTMKATVAQQSIHDVHVGRILAQIDDFYGQDQTFDLTQQMSRMLWDLVSELSFGEPLVVSRWQCVAILRSVLTANRLGKETSSHS